MDEAADTGAAQHILQSLDGDLKSVTSFDRRTSAMLTGLAHPAAGPYEQALVDLGLLLGAAAWRPAEQGQADAVWQWEEMWATLEAKTEQQSEGALSLKYVRQANTQLDSVASGSAGGVAPEASFSAVISPRTVVEPTGVTAARPHLYLVEPAVMLELAHDSIRAWTEIRGSVLGVAGDKAVDAVFFALYMWRVQPTQVRERLTGSPIRGN